MDRTAPAYDLRNRTKTFAIGVVRLCRRLPLDASCRVIRNQLLRSATSVGANYRSACRAHTKTAFIAKMSVVEEEADESHYWLELLEKLSPTPNAELLRLKDEALQLTKIMAASKKTARSHPTK